MSPQETVSHYETAMAGVDAVARFYESWLGEASPFHLSPCGGCGAPAFGQPCSICNFYPMGADKGTWSPKVATKEHFINAIERSGPGKTGGNLATWLVSYYHNTSIKNRVPDAIREAAKLDLPPAELFWQVVIEDGKSLSRPFAGLAIHNGWYALSDLSSQMSKAASYGKIDPRSYARLQPVVDMWVAAVHSGDPDQQLHAANEMRSLIVHASQIIPHNGNLIGAKDDIDKTIEALEAGRTPAASL